MSGGWSPARALAWEWLRLSWRPVVGTTLAAGALAAIYRRLLAPLGEGRDAVVISSLLVILSIVYATTLLSCRGDGLGVGFERRLLLLPLSTPLLVAGRLVPALLSVVVMQAAVGWLMRALFGAPWPLLGSGMLTAAVAGWTLALVWSCGRRALAIAPLGVVMLVVLLAWLKPRLRADPLWSRLAPRDAAILALATALAALVAVWGVTRSRRGEAAAPSRPRPIQRLLAGWRNDPAAATASASSRLPSAWRGQLWMEWREKGRWLSFGALLWLALAVGASALPAPESGAMLRQAVHDYLPFALLLLPPLAGFLHGSFRLTSRVAGIDAFRATRPVGDRELADVILLSAARSCAAGAGATIAGVALLALGLWRFGNGAPVEELARGIAAAFAGIGAGRAALAACVMAAAAWAALGVVAAIALCGRSWLSFLAFVVPLLAVSIVLIADIAEVDVLAHAGPALLVPFGVLLPLGAAAAWALAVRGQLIPARTALLAALVWAASTILLVRLLPMLFAAPLIAGEPLPRWLLSAAAGMTAAVLLPTALAPLALRWNRHR